MGDGSLIPVIDSATLLELFVSPRQTAALYSSQANLPTVQNMALPIGQLPSIPSEGLALSRNTTPRLLVVDDSIAMRQTLTLTLQKAGYQVLQARDGREAIEQLQQNPSLELVICDIEMPNMNGFEFLTYRRQDPMLSKIPVVMLTSRSSEKHRRLAMFSGASGYFTKPYVEQEFLAGIKTLVNHE